MKKVDGLHIIFRASFDLGRVDVKGTPLRFISLAT
jgi:hypothetical protein